MQTRWTIFTTARSEAAALRVARCLLSLADLPSTALTVQARRDGHEGHGVTCFGSHGRELPWSDWVLHCLTQAQRMAHNWQLSGDIQCELLGWSNQPRVAGVQALELQTRLNASVEQQARRSAA